MAARMPCGSHKMIKWYEHWVITPFKMLPEFWLCYRLLESPPLCHCWCPYCMHCSNLEAIYTHVFQRRHQICFISECLDPVFIDLVCDFFLPCIFGGSIFSDHKDWWEVIFGQEFSYKDYRPTDRRRATAIGPVDLKIINKRPPGLIAPPFTIGFLTTENLPKVKLGQVEVGSNITQNHSSRLWEVISCHYLPPIHMKSWLKVKSSQVEAGSNIAQNHSPRLQEVISCHICPTWNDDQICWSQVEQFSKSLIQPPESHIWS